MDTHKVTAIAVVLVLLSTSAVLIGNLLPAGDDRSDLSAVGTKGFLEGVKDGDGFGISMTITGADSYSLLRLATASIDPENFENTYLSGAMENIAKIQNSETLEDYLSANDGYTTDMKVDVVSDTVVSTVDPASGLRNIHSKSVMRFVGTDSYDYDSPAYLAKQKNGFPEGVRPFENDSYRFDFFFQVDVNVQNDIIKGIFIQTDIDYEENRTRNSVINEDGSLSYESNAGVYHHTHDMQIAMALKLDGISSLSEMMDVLLDISSDKSIVATADVLGTEDFGTDFLSGRSDPYYLSQNRYTKTIEIPAGALALPLTWYGLSEDDYMEAYTLLKDLAQRGLIYDTAYPILKKAGLDITKDQYDALVYIAKNKSLPTYETMAATGLLEVLGIDVDETTYSAFRAVIECMKGDCSYEHVKAILLAADIEMTQAQYDMIYGFLTTGQIPAYADFIATFPTVEISAEQYQELSDFITAGYMPSYSSLMLIAEPLGIEVDEEEYTHYSNLYNIIRGIKQDSAYETVKPLFEEVGVEITEEQYNLFKRIVTEKYVPTPQEFYIFFDGIIPAEQYDAIAAFITDGTVPEYQTMVPLFEMLGLEIDEDTFNIGMAIANMGRTVITEPTYENAQVVFELMGIHVTEEQYNLLFKLATDRSSIGYADVSFIFDMMGVEITEQEYTRLLELYALAQDGITLEIVEEVLDMFGLLTPEQFRTLCVLLMDHALPPYNEIEFLFQMMGIEISEQVYARIVEDFGYLSDGFGYYSFLGLNDILLGFTGKSFYLTEEQFTDAVNFFHDAKDAVSDFAKDRSKVSFYVSWKDLVIGASSKAVVKEASAKLPAPETVNLRVLSDGEFHFNAWISGNLMLIEEEYGKEVLSEEFQNYSLVRSWDVFSNGGKSYTENGITYALVERPGYISGWHEGCAEIAYVAIIDGTETNGIITVPETVTIDGVVHPVYISYPKIKNVQRLNVESFTYNFSYLSERGGQFNNGTQNQLLINTKFAGEEFYLYSQRTNNSAYYVYDLSATTMRGNVGYYVDKWYLDEGMTQEVNPDMPYTGDLIIYGQFKEGYVVVIHDSNGYTYRVPAEPGAPLRGYYSLYLDSGYTTFYDNEPITQNMIMYRNEGFELRAHALWYASWGDYSNVSYYFRPVSFNVNGGNLSVTNHVYYNSPDVYGYVIDYWYTYDNGNLQILNGTYTSESNIRDIYAHYILAPMTVTFVVDDSKGVGNISPITEAYTNHIKLPQVEAKPGYKFVGWVDPNFRLYEASDYGYRVNGNVTLTAAFVKEDIETVTVSYTIDSEYSDEKVQEEVVTIDRVFLSLPEPEAKEGYEFLGWSYNGQEITLPCIVKQDMQLTAMFGTTVTVTFLVDGQTVASDSYLTGKRILLPEEPVKASDAQYDYEFVRWDGYTSGMTAGKEDLTFTAVFNGVLRSYDVTFQLNEISSVTVTVPYGTAVPADQVPAVPEKAPTVQYEYVGSWQGFDANTTVTGAATYVLVYTENPRPYEIIFLNEDGTELQKTSVPYGTVPAYTGATPVKQASNEHTYTFNGWDTELVAVTGTATYTATYLADVVSYEIRFVNEDGTELQKTSVPYGSVPQYYGQVPTKAATAQYTYAFDGWDVQPVAVTGAATYTATFSHVTNVYDIVFMNGNDVVSTVSKEYGTTLTQNEIPSVPVKAATAQYTYTDGVWKDFVATAAVTGAATYYPEYTETLNHYDIVFMNGNDVVSTVSVGYGQTVPVSQVPAVPAKAADAQYTYTDGVWARFNANAQVTGAATYYAEYTETLNHYDIVFMNGNDVVSTVNKAYGSTLTQNEIPSVPAKAADAQYTYTDGVWTGFNANAQVTGAATYYAGYTETLNHYDIVFMNGNDVVSTVNKAYGSTLTQNEIPAVPAKAATAQYTYTDGVWKDFVATAAVTGAATYYAEYTATVNRYTVTFYTDDTLQTVFSAQTDDYGTAIVLPAAIPAKDNTYVFSVWHGFVPGVITGNASYYAEYVVGQTQTNDDGSTTTVVENNDGSTTTTNYATDGSSTVKDESTEITATDGVTTTTGTVTETSKDANGNTVESKETVTTNIDSDAETVNKTTVTNMDQNNAVTNTNVTVEIESKTSEVSTSATIEVTGDGQASATAESTVGATVENGAATVGAADIDTAIAQLGTVVTEAQAVDGNTAVSKTVTVDVSTGTADQAKVSIPATSVGNVGGSDASLSVKAGVGTIEISSEIASHLASKTSDASANVELGISTYTGEMTQAQKDLVGDRKVIQLTATVGGVYAGNDLGGTAKVTVPYELKDGEDPNKITVFFVSDDGSVEKRETTYDAASKSVSFSTNRFSYYVIAEENAFDISNPASAGFDVMILVIAAIVIVAAAAVVLVVRARHKAN